MPDTTSSAVASHAQSRVGKVALASFLAAFVAVCVRPEFFIGPEANGLEDVGLLLTAAISLLVSISTTLPFQNVLLAFVVAGLLGGVTHALSALTDFPLGAIAFSPASGPRICGTVPWSIPVIWIVLLFASRGTARVLLQPWRQTTNYGLKNMGATAVLAAVIAFGLELYATQGGRYWSWTEANSSPHYAGIPGSCFLGWIITTLLLNFLVTAFLINKKPAEPPPPKAPLIVWVLLNLLFGSFALERQFQFAAGTTLVAAIAVTVASVLIYRRSRVPVRDGA